MDFSDTNLRQQLSSVLKLYIATGSIFYAD